MESRTPVACRRAPSACYVCSRMHAEKRGLTADCECASLSHSSTGSSGPEESLPRRWHSEHLCPSALIRTTAKRVPTHIRDCPTSHAVEVKSSRLLRPAEASNRPADEVSFCPRCEFDGIAEGTGQPAQTLPRTGCCAMFRRLYPHHGSGEGAFGAADCACDRRFSARSLHRILEPGAECESGENEYGGNGDPSQTSRNLSSLRSVKGS